MSENFTRQEHGHNDYLQFVCASYAAWGLVQFVEDPILLWPQDTELELV